MVCKNTPPSVRITPEFTGSEGVFYYPEDNIHCVSRHTWEDIAHDISNLAHTNSTILTPELGTVLGDDALSRLHNTPEIRRRVREVAASTAGTDSTIFIGAPLRSSSASEILHNGLLTIRNGRIIHAQRKTFFGFYERGLGHFEEYPEPNAYHAVGQTALICSEIMNPSLTSSVKATTEVVCAATCWGVPSITPEAVERYGGVDPYNQMTLQYATKMLAERLTNVRTLYVADAPVDGNKPLTGKFSISRAE